MKNLSKSFVDDKIPLRPLHRPVGDCENSIEKFTQTCRRWPYTFETMVTFGCVIFETFWLWYIGFEHK